MVPILFCWKSYRTENFLLSDTFGRPAVNKLSDILVHCNAKDDHPDEDDRAEQ